MKFMETKAAVDACASAAHEANRAYCKAIGDSSQPTWDQAPDWQQDSARNGVRGALAGSTPAESHAAWMSEKVATSWRYGPTKDPVAKTHPCMVEYGDLPLEQRAKDELFLAVVRAVAKALESRAVIA